MSRRVAVVSGAVASLVLMGVATGLAPLGHAAPPLVEGAAMRVTGKEVFEKKGNCGVCHGPIGKGTPMAPDLTDDEWLTIDGTRESIVAVVRTGVTKPKQFRGMMPPMGGAQLTEEEIAGVADYVLSLRAMPAE